jgi:dolichol-phosphate mannosyltransferase
VPPDPHAFETEKREPPGLDAALVVVPTYNEAGNVEELVRRIHALAPGLHLLFVDDNSTDGTRAALVALAAADPSRIHLIKRDRKLGLGTAYVAAFKWALARSYAAVVEMDADLSHRPEDLVKLLAAVRTAPVVVGSRYVPGGGTENWGLGRQLISRAGSLYGRLILRLAINDFTGGFNAWQRGVLERIGVDEIRSEGYAFQIELKFRAHLAGFPLQELPIVFVERRAGQSKMSGAIVVEAVYRVWQLAWRRRRFVARLKR